MITYTEKRFFEWYEDDVCVTLRNKGGSYGGGSEVFVMGTYSFQGFGEYKKNEVGSSLKQKDFKEATDLIQTNTVRRLTPLECERLQGFPDGWTLIGEPESHEGDIPLLEKEDPMYEPLDDDELLEEYGKKREYVRGMIVDYYYTDEKGKKKKCSDSARYKALGNSITLPFWEWMAKRMCAVIGRPATMGSLFDGIGGFPLVYSRAGAEPVWASEIEEFPIAVTKIRFPG